jgi:hypothetical protein
LKWTNDTNEALRQISHEEKKTLEEKEKEHEQQ